MIAYEHGCCARRRTGALTCCMDFHSPTVLHRSRSVPFLLRPQVILPSLSSSLRLRLVVPCPALFFSALCIWFSRLSVLHRHSPVPVVPSSLVAHAPRLLLLVLLFVIPSLFGSLPRLSDAFVHYLSPASRSIDRSSSAFVLLATTFHVHTGSYSCLTLSVICWSACAHVHCWIQPHSGVVICRLPRVRHDKSSRNFSQSSNLGKI